MECSCNCQENVQVQVPGDLLDLSELDAVLEEYKDQAGSLVTVLQKAQGIYGYLPVQVLRHIAVEMKVKPAQVYGVATFYTQFRFTPVGKYLILLCQGTACHVNGSERIETALCQELKIKPGETTGDRLFTLTDVACLGCCSLAPVMMINGQAYGPLTPDKAVGIVKDLRAREQQVQEGGEQQ
ncbi:MAG: NADH-quinone oxidoreductase subunit NuoE [Syntrophomonas sp.]